MNYQHALIFYRVITPLHVGCGQAVGVVDLPVIRERAAGYPFIPGSGIRGSLRNDFEKKRDAFTNPEEREKFNDLILTLFGPESGDTAEEDLYAGCLAVHDARLLFYPVRADKQVFLWITCPLALQRFNRDAAAFGIKTGSGLTDGDMGSLAGDEFHKQYLGPALGAIHLEEFRLEHAAGKDTLAGKLAEFAETVAPDLKNRAVLVSDRNFYHFVNYATMLVQHNTLTSAKTVKEGALFSVESLPPETILYGMIGAADQRKDAGKNGVTLLAKKDVLTEFKQSLLGKNAAAYLHLGGKESTGLGVTELRWVGN